MARAILIAYSSPVPDQEQAFNDWYANTHIPQVRAAVPSITEVSRYRTVDPTGQSDEVRYITTYEMDTDDVASAAGLLGGAMQDGKLDPTDTMDVTVNPPVLVWAQGV
jgi:hypothetical protein